MNKTFDSAMTAIMEIENAIKAARKQGKKTSARQGDYTFGVVLLLIFMGFSLSASAVTKQNADTEYTKGNHQQAIKDHEDLLKNGVSPEVYYNLGNAYYRTDNITKAVPAYERAHLLSPGDEDINFNLQFARSKTIDKITPVSEMFFVTGTRRWSTSPVSTTGPRRASCPSSLPWYWCWSISSHPSCCCARSASSAASSSLSSSS